MKRFGVVFIFILLTTAIACADVLTPEDQFELPVGYFADFRPEILEVSSPSTASLAPFPCPEHEIEVTNTVLEVRWVSISDYVHHLHTYYDAFCRFCDRHYTNVYIASNEEAHNYQKPIEWLDFERNSHVIEFNCTVCMITLPVYHEECGLLKKPMLPCVCPTTPF